MGGEKSEQKNCEKSVEEIIQEKYFMGSKKDDEAEDIHDTHDSHAETPEDLGTYDTPDSAVMKKPKIQNNKILHGGAMYNIKLDKQNIHKIISNQASTLSPKDYMKEVPHYNMNNEKRGIALVLNHHSYIVALNERNGTYEDEKRLRTTFAKLGFKVIVKNDVQKAEIKSTLIDISQMDHSNYDCLVVVVMTHGGQNELWASDKTYPVRKLYEPFFGESCPTLIGKPKLFFIQACRGLNTINNVRFSQTDTISQPNTTIVNCSIPTMADMLVMHSTFEGFVAWRNAEFGSWFIQSLCDELDINGTTQDLLTLLTSVSRRVAYNYESIHPEKQYHEKKQMPTIISTLTKILFFSPKQQSDTVLQETEMII